MSRLTTTVGVAAVLLALAALVLGVEVDATLGAVAVALLAFLGIALTVWKLFETPEDESIIRPPWTEDGALVDRPPEHGRGDEALSGESFAAVLTEAGEAARSEGEIDAGLAVVRPVLRRTLIDALTLTEPDRVAVDHALATGAWTDDRRAAAVLEPAVDPPALSRRERIEAWLFPERVVRRHLQVAVQAVAEAAEEAVPTVPGQQAPRSVPVLQPRLADLRRGVDGEVRAAVDPLATARGPRPPGSEAHEVDVSAGEGDQPPDPTDERTATGDEETPDGTASDEGDDADDATERVATDLFPGRDGGEP